MRTLGPLAAVVLVAALGAAEPASAKTVALRGQVIGETFKHKKRTAVRVLLDAKSAKRAKLKSPIGVLHVKARRARVARRKPIAMALLRPNDRVRTRARVRRSLRDAAYWRIRARALRVTKRAKTLSAAELEQLIDDLRRDLASLSETVADLARYTANGFRLVDAELDALRAELNALRSDFTALSAQVAAVSAQLAALESLLRGQLDELAGDLAGLGAELQGVIDDVAALNAAVAGLSAQLVTLQGQVATLTAELATLSATVASLSGQLGDLSNLGGTVEELLTGVAPGDLADALSDIATLQSSLAALEGVVGGPSSGLVQQVNDLSTVVGSAGSGLVQAVSDLQAADVATQADITALEAGVATAEARLDSLETLVSGAGGIEDDIAALQTTVGDASSGLVQQVNGLQSDVDALCGPSSLLDALC